MPRFRQEQVNHWQEIYAGFVPTFVYAKENGMTTDEVYSMALHGRLESRRIGGKWLFVKKKEDVCAVSA